MNWVMDHEGCLAFAQFPWSRLSLDRGNSRQTRFSRRYRVECRRVWLVRGQVDSGNEGEPRVTKPQRPKGTRVDDILGEYGFRKERPGGRQDAELEAARGQSQRNGLAEPGSGYRLIVATVGVKGAGFLSRALEVLLLGLVGAIVVTGVTIGLEAYFKSSGQAVPSGLEQATVWLEGGFTPEVLAFFFLSVTYGLFKQSELESGVAAYSDKKRDER